MMRKIKGIGALAAVLIIFMAVSLTLQLNAAQYYRLHHLDVYNMGGYNRVVIQCDGPVKYIHKHFSAIDRLSIYLRYTQIDLTQKTFFYKNGMIRAVKIVQWKESPPVVRVDIYLNGALEFKIHQSIDGLLNIDFSNGEKKDSKELADPGYSQISGERPFKQTEVKNQNRAGFDNDHTNMDLELNSTVINGKKSDYMPGPLESAEKITLDVKAADMSNVLRLLAKQSKLNIVASKDVKGLVTVSLVGVTVKEALDMVVKANGLDYTVNGDVVLVKPRDNFDSLELETKVYRLKYVDANNLKSAVSKILSANAVVHVFYHDFHAVLEDKEKDKKESDEKERSSTLIVTDTPAKLKQMDAMIVALDVPTPQIMIEAKLIEISPQTEQQLGINWDKTINAQIFREIILPSSTPWQYSADVPLDGGSINYGTLSLGRYNAVLEFLNKRTNAKLVSNPRIMAMDNQEAVISVGTTFPIPQINRGVGGQGDQVTFVYRDVNIALKVTPHLAGDDLITLFVNPDIEEVIGEVIAGGNSAPITSKRTVETVVNLKNNETVVIGGLIKENLVETDNKVWLLGDIPLLGNFFRSKNKLKKQTDLLIFITPRIVKTF